MAVTKKYTKLKSGDIQAINLALNEVAKSATFRTKDNLLYLISLGGDPLYDKNNMVNYIKDNNPFFLNYILTHCDVDLTSKYRGGHLLDIAINYNPKYFALLYNYGAGISKNIFTNYVTFHLYTSPEIYHSLINDNRVVKKFNMSFINIFLFYVSDIITKNNVDIIADILYRCNQEIGTINFVRQLKSGENIHIYYGIKNFVEAIEDPLILNLSKRLILLGVNNTFIELLYQRTKSPNLLPLLGFLDYYESRFNPDDFNFYPQPFQQEVFTLIACNEFSTKLDFLPNELLIEIIKYMR